MTVADPLLSITSMLAKAVLDGNACQGTQLRKCSINTRIWNIKSFVCESKMIPKIIGTTEAAALMQLSEQRIRTLLKQGKIEGQQVGKQWLVDHESLAAFLKNPENHVNPPDRVRNGKAKPNMVALSFFSGAMGLDLGLEKAGIEVLLACEFDKACRKTIAVNKPEIALLGDIWDYSAQQIRAAAGLSPTDKIDVIVGGPPCQAFSTAGARRGFDDDRGNAMMRYLDLIESLQPEYAVIENVRGLLSAPLSHRPHADRDASYSPAKNELPGGALMLVLARLRSMGYGISFNLYNSANFGTPQVRERVVMMCHKGGEVLPYLTPTHSDNPVHGLPKWKTFRDAVSGMSEADQRSIAFPENRLRYFRMLKSGQYWKSLPVDLQKEALGKSYFSGGGKTGFLRRLDWEKPSPTLVTHPAMPATDLAHPAENRPLSVQEYKRIQQFPDDWILCGSLLDQYKQVGNAVPVGLGEAIGKLILNHRRGIVDKTYPGFRYSRYKDTDSLTWEKVHGRLHASEEELGKKNLELFELS
jgi:DNA (cytosine-5)-methyltransferase 1